MPEACRQFARRFIAELMAALAAVRLHPFDPLLLAFHAGRNSVAGRSRSGELALGRKLQSEYQ